MFVSSLLLTWPFTNKLQFSVSLLFTSSIRFSRQTASTLVHAFVLSRLIYSNYFPWGCPPYIIHKLQKVQNSAARFVLKAREQDHVTPLKLFVLCFSFFWRYFACQFLLTSFPLHPYQKASLFIRPVHSIYSCHQNETYYHRLIISGATKQWNSLLFFPYPSTLLHIQHSHTLHMIFT